MQFLRSTNGFAKMQKAAMWNAFSFKNFFRQYLLTNIYSISALLPL